MSDHRPLFGCFGRIIHVGHFHSQETIIRNISTKGWQPLDESENDLFRHKCLNDSIDIRNLQNWLQGVVEAASTVKHDSAGSRKRLRISAENMTVRIARGHIYI